MSGQHKHNIRQSGRAEPAQSGWMPHTECAVPNQKWLWPATVKLKNAAPWRISLADHYRQVQILAWLQQCLLLVCTGIAVPPFCFAPEALVLSCTGASLHKRTHTHIYTHSLYLSLALTRREGSQRSRPTAPWGWGCHQCLSWPVSSAAGGDCRSWRTWVPPGLKAPCCQRWARMQRPLLQ